MIHVSNQSGKPEPILTGSQWESLSNKPVSRQRNTNALIRIFVCLVLAALVVMFRLAGSPARRQRAHRLDSDGSFWVYDDELGWVEK